MPCKIVDIIYCISSFVANVCGVVCVWVQMLGVCVCALKRTQTQTHSHLFSTATLKMSTTTTATAKSKNKEKNKKKTESYSKRFLMFGGALHSFINVMFFCIVHLFLWFLFCVFCWVICAASVFVAAAAHSSVAFLSITLPLYLGAFILFARTSNSS